MSCLRRLPGFQRSPPGLEWRIWKKLHWIFLAGTALPLLASAAAYGLNDGARTSGGDRSVEQFFYAMLGLVALDWTLTLTLALACGIVILMKGPAYAADDPPAPPGSS